MTSVEKETAVAGRLPAYGEFYYQNVLAEYEATVGLTVESGAEIETQTARAIAGRVTALTPRQISWADLFSFEHAVARLQPIERVRQRICSLRMKYRAVFGQAAHDEYLKCAPADLNAAKPIELRSELATLLSEFQWYYSASRTRDTLFHDLRYNMFVPLLVYGIFVVGIAWWRVLQGQAVPGLAVVILAGVIGAFTSILRRLQLAQAQVFSPLDDPVAKFSELGVGSLSIYLALASGAIFPVVLLLIFVAGWITGDMFPAMYSPPPGDTGMTFLEFANETGPKSGVDFAKLLIWSFISGFAERFVPDILDKVVSRDTPPMVGTPKPPEAA